MSQVVNSTASAATAGPETFLDGTRKDAARPCGAPILDVTLSLLGNQLILSTKAGHTTVILTPEQQATLNSEIPDLQG